MNSKNMLKLDVNYASRVCVISDVNGTVLLRMPIKGEGYNKANIVERLGKLNEVIHYTPEAKLPNADVTVYEALKEYDSTHETNYSKEYLKIVIDKIPYKSPDKDEPILERALRKITGRMLEKEADYLRRARKIKAEQLSELGLSITYSDIETIEASSELSSTEKGVAIAIVKRQQGHNGIETGKLDKVSLIQGEGKEQPPVQPKVEEQPIVIEQPVKQKENQQPVQPEVPVVKPEKIEQTEKAKVEQKAKQKSAPKPKNKKKKIEGIRESREAYRQRLQAGKPKKADRPEGALAPKRETKQERKARLAKEAAEQRKLASIKKAEATKQAVTSDKSANTPKETVVKISEEPIKVRFTRKLKDATDSIRNKVYKPHKKLLNICGCVAIAGLVLLAGFKGYQHFNSNNSPDAISETTSVVQVMEDEDLPEELGASGEETIEKDELPPVTPPQTENQSSSDSTNTEIEDTQNVVTESQTTVDNQENAIMVDSGKYFSSPDGTGAYGYFENYQDCKKEMTIIGLATYEGYTKVGTKIEVKDEDGNVNRYIQIKTNEGDIIVEADNVELAESIVRQNYPNARYMSIHFEAEHEDESRTTLGWVRSDILEKNLDNTRSQAQIEDLER